MIPLFGGASLSSVELFQKGGPIMYLLLICSLTVVAIAIDRYRLYKRANAGAAELLGALKKPWNEAELKDAAAKGDNVVATLVRDALEAGGEARDIRAAIDASYETMAFQLRARLNYLSMIVTMAPLLGLLGTIFGMIQSFSIFNLQAGQPMAITGGIGEALIATATGLCVAILALIAHTYFAQRLDELLTAMDQADSIVSAHLVGGEPHEA